MMIKVRFHAPRGVGPRGPEGFGEGFTRDHEMKAVPRVGETVAFSAPNGGEDTYRVHGVHWYSDVYDFDVYVVLR